MIVPEKPTPLSIVIAAPAACADTLLAALRQGGFEPRHALVGGTSELVGSLAHSQWDVLLLSDQLPGLTLDKGLALAQALRLPLLWLAHAADLAAARAALAAGAADVIWASHLEQLPLAVARLLRDRAAPIEQDAFQGNRTVQMLVDPQTGEVVDANPAAAEYYGYSQDQLRHMSVWELSQNERPSARANLSQTLLKPGGVITSQHRLATGELRDVEVRASLVQQGERPLLFSIVNDVTDQRQRERELEAVAAFAAALRGAASRTSLTVAILEELRKLTGAKGAAVVLRDANGDLVTQAAQNWPRTDGGALASRVMTSGQPEWINQAVPASAKDPLATGQPWTVAVPLVAQGLALGALCYSAESPPSPAQLRLLGAIGDMAANALHRSTLYEQTEQRVQRLAALHAIDIAITASFDLRVTLGVFLDHLMSQMAVDAAAVLLLSSATQTLEYVAIRGLTTRPLRQTPLRLTDSVPGRVATQRQPLHITDLNAGRPPATRAYPPEQASFNSYYGAPLLAKGRVLGVLEVLSRGALQPDPEWVEFFSSLSTQAAIAIDSATLFNDLQRSNVELNLAYDATIEGWSRVLEARGIESSGHTRRVADMTVRLGQQAGLSQADLVQLRRGALLHDVGMLSIPESVLHKPGPLSEAERAVVQQHPDYGFNILAPIIYLRPALDIPYSHHERWDGSGYPRGLLGDIIPLAARIFAVVDVWDALRAEKPYRAPWTDAAARAYLQTNAGKQFDPALVSLFLQSEDRP